MRYKFWFEVNIPNKKSSDNELQDLFQSVADAIQYVCPFNDDDWDFCVKSEGEDDT